MSAILEQSETVTTLIGTVWDMICANPVLATFVVCGLITAAIGVFGAIKGTAHF